MHPPVQGELHSGSFRYAIITSRFNDMVTRRLTEGAIDCLKRHGADDSQVTIILCPGSFELPLVARHVVDKGGFDALICLGAVIRGATPHFDVIAAEVTKGLAQVALDSRIPVAFGVLTTDTMEQALERAGLKSGNKGWEAALSAIEMVNLLKNLNEL